MIAGKRVKPLIALTAALFASSIMAGPWSWLDDTEQQYWSNITISGYGRMIEFSIPDRAKKRGSHVIRMPALNKGEKDQHIEVSPDYLLHPGNRIAAYVWERYWGGFFKEDVTDYTFDVYVGYVGEDVDLLDLNVDDRIQRIKDYYHGRFNSERNHDWFFDRFRIDPYKSAQSYFWTQENSPTVLKEHETFRLPISQHHELLFTFYYRQELQGGKGDPAWLERRRHLSRKILDTVRITPNPFELSLE
jgi:hypothetical protein